MSISRTLRELGQGLWSLLFPHLCLHCRGALAAGQAPALCTDCTGRLARTRYWEIPENGLTDRFAGRLPLTFGAALYHFRHDSVCQSIVHALKYYDRPEVGDQFGRILGELLRTATPLEDLHAIVPVPIHPQRRHERGYNQAEHLAAGLGEALGLPVRPDALVRTQFKTSQTKLDRSARQENVSHSFAIGRGDFTDRHLLLVDDVVTTGATLDVCGNLLLERHPGCRISIAALAIAG